jgi:hypothetical protein
MTDLTADEVLQVAKTLRMYAEHFAPRDWDWTRDHRIKRITYRPSRRPTRGRARRDGRPGKLRWFDPSELPARVWHALSGALEDKRRPLFPDDPRMRVGPWRMFKARLRSQNLPDGCLDGGGVVVYWEETGEYIQMVQPSVGSRIADLLEDRPEDAHSKAIAGEMKRVLDRYSARIAANGGDWV